MPTSAQSDTSSNPKAVLTAPPGWAKLGLVAIATVVLGGMATAWWYRKTLIRLRQAGETAPNPHFGMSEDDSGDDI